MGPSVPWWEGQVRKLLPGKDSSVLQSWDPTDTALLRGEGGGVQQVDRITMM